MKLHNLKISRFRSAGSVSVNDIADFNVLIGRNNAGKSTVLLAIEAFFNCLRGDGLIRLSPPFEKKIDFTNQTLDEPISFLASFLLSDEERTNLLNDMVRETQQLRQMVSTIESPLLVEIEVFITQPPGNYSYVRSIRLRGRDNSNQDQAKTLLSIPPDGARELAEQQRAVSSASARSEEIKRALETIEAEDFNRAKSDPEGRYVRFMLTRTRGFSMGSAAAKDIDQLVQTSESYTAFRTAATNLQQQLLSEVNDTLRRPLSSLLQTFSGDQSSVPGYAKRLIQAIASMTILYLTERRDPVGRTEAKQLLDYKVTRGGPERLKEIQQKIASLLGVAVDAFESDRSQGGERIAEMDVDQFLLEVNGSGVKEALRLILDLELKRPDILLAEEPEVHLHPALEINVMEYLRQASSKCQIFITTHSTNFLDLSNAQGVYFVTKPETTVVKRINRDEAEAEIPKELGLRLSSLFMFDRLAFVEGLSDELILREFAIGLGVNLSQSNVGFVQIGGARNFGYYAGEAVLSTLARRQVKSTFILDRDERDDAEITLMRNKLGDRASLCVWKRRELENYLLAPAPMARYIARKMEAAGAIPKQAVTEQSVLAALLKCAEGLRALTICKRAGHVLLGSVHPSLTLQPEIKFEEAQGVFTAEIKRLQDALAAQEALVPKALADVKKAVDATYSNGWGTLVCGDILLDETFKTFGTRFRKLADGPKLAAEFKPTEIDQEVANVIRALGAVT